MPGALALQGMVSKQRPMTVRQVFYQATVRGVVEKAESGYAKVQTDLVCMRRAGVIPYGWLADSTRWQSKPTTYDSVQDALEETARLYSKIALGRGGQLCRSVAREGCARRGNLSDHVAL